MWRRCRKMKNRKYPRKSLHLFLTEAEKHSKIESSQFRRTEVLVLSAVWRAFLKCTAELGLEQLNNCSVVLAVMKQMCISQSPLDEAPPACSSISRKVSPPRPLFALCQHINSSVLGLLALRSPCHTLQRPLSLLYNSLGGWIKEAVEPRPVSKAL